MCKSLPFIGMKTLEYREETGYILYFYQMMSYYDNTEKSLTFRDIKYFRSNLVPVLLMQ